MNHSRKIKHFFFWIGYLFLFMIPILMHSQSVSTSFSSDNGKNKIIRKNGTTEYKIEYEGKISINDQDTDIIAISNGGFIKISKSAFGSRRKVEITPEAGRLLKLYFVGNSKTDFEPEGRKWLAEVLPEVVRSTIIGASSRVDRFYRKGGTQGVLAEIHELDGDYVKSEYFDLLLKKGPNSSDLAKIASTAGQEINSDHYLAEVLGRNQQVFLASSEGTSAYIQATNSFNSDHYRAAVLKKAIRNGNVSDANLVKLLKSSGQMNSDHYVVEVLSTLLNKRKVEGNILESLLQTSKRINSDHYKAEVLKKALSESSISESAYNTLLETVNDMNSDHYIAEVLTRVLGKNNLSNSNFDNILKAAANINSDHYASEVMSKISGIDNLTESQLVKTLGVIGNINSDHYLSMALRAFANKTNSSGKSAKDAYKVAAKKINSEHEYGAAMRVLNN